MGYSYSDNDEVFTGLCDTVEDAIAEALDEFPDANSVYVGKAIQKTIGEYLNDNLIESLLESIAENAGEECGEATDGWLHKLPKKELSNLRGQIQAVLEEWATQSGYQPNFYYVGNVEQVKCLET